MNQFLNTTAKVISYTLSPLAIPFLSIVFVFQTNSTFYRLIPEPLHKLILGISLFFMVIMPLFTLVLMRRYKMIPHVEIPQSKDRRIPLLLSCIYLMLGYFALNQLVEAFDLKRHISLLWLAGVMVLVIAAIINMWYKISIHMLCMGAFVALMVCFSASSYFYTLEVICLLVLLSGLVGFARWQLQAHTPLQILAGFFVGFFVEYACLSGFWA